MLMRRDGGFSAAGRGGIGFVRASSFVLLLGAWLVLAGIAALVDGVICLTSGATNDCSKRKEKVVGQR